MCSPGPSCTYAAFGMTTGSTITWQDGARSVTCAGPLPPPPAPGASVTVNSTNGNTGTYRATCRADGTWDPNALVTCDEVDNRCAAADVAWTGVGGAQCSARTSRTPFGETVTVRSTSANSGQARVTCNAGRWSAPFEADCTTPAPTCPGGGTMAWGNCYGNGPAQEMQDGARYTSANLAFGYAGSANLVCRSGVWVQENATCASAAPAQPQGGCSLGASWGSAELPPSYNQMGGLQGACSGMAENVPPSIELFGCGEGLGCRVPANTVLRFTNVNAGYEGSAQMGCTLIMAGNGSGVGYYTWMPVVSDPVCRVK